MKLDLNFSFELYYILTEDQCSGRLLLRQRIIRQKCLQACTCGFYINNLSIVIMVKLRFHEQFWNI